MRIAVTGASGVLGRGLTARLLSQGHEVVGIARHRPDSWPSSADFIAADIRDATAVESAMTGADVVAHCAWVRGRNDHINIDGTANVLKAMAETGTGRIVFTSSGHQPRVEQMLADCGLEWVAVRCALIFGRNVDNWVQRLFALPVLPAGYADRVVQVVHSDDAQRLLVRALLDAVIDSGPVNLAAPGELTFRRIAAALGRPMVPIGSPVLRRVTSFAELELLHSAPLMDVTLLRDRWGFQPAWNAEECLEDFTLAVRGRIGLGKRTFSLPWRLANIQDLPAVDSPADDGVAPRLAGPEGANGEFDTPIDPRFPTYLATNLSEALPGPFSPSSASVTVRGLRAGGVGIAERLRPSGVIQREIAMRTVAVFAHRLYGAITSAHFMAATVPFAKPATIVSNSGFFGPSMASLPIFGAQRPPSESSRARRWLRTLRNIGVFGVNLVGLSAGSPRDTDAYVADVDRLERLAFDNLATHDDRRLLSLILLARDHVVHGWVLASGSFMLCAAFNVLLRGLSP